MKVKKRRKTLKEEQEDEYEPFNEGSEENSMNEMWSDDEEFDAGEWSDAGDNAETFMMMDGSINMRNFAEFRSLLTLILNEWINESDYGFSKENVKDMINYLIDKQY